MGRNVGTVSRPPGQRPWEHVVTGVAAVGLAAVIAVLALGWFDAPAHPLPAAVEPAADRRTAEDLAAMSDAELAKLDPLVMNLIVARGIPGLDHLDIGWYSSIVDSWAQRINAANLAAEPTSHDDPTYRVSREFWMAGGMAVMLAGPAFGTRYTTEHLDAEHPEQQFVYGVIDQRMGTCASMPVLYMAIGYRLGWPIKAVVSGDHMWARWDDGRPGGQRFNLEATSVRSSGGVGSFGSMTDEQYATDLGTPRAAIASGSDFTSLTPRQTLGAFLQSRAGFWAARRQWDRAERDLRLAVTCFPQNRDIRQIYQIACAGGRAPRLVSGGLSPRELEAQARAVERLNRANEDALKRLVASPPNPKPQVPLSFDPD